MAHRFPRRVPLAGQAINAQDINDGLLPYVEEFGRFNEHNMGEALKTSLERSTQLADDVAMRYHHVSVTDDVSWRDPVGTITANAALIPSTGTWELVDDLTATFRTEGTALYVLGSLQHAIQGTAPDSDLYTLLGIRLDGTVLTNLTVGDQDTQDEGPNMETGLSGWRLGMTIEGSFPVTPGTHTVEIVAKVLPRGDVKPTFSPAARIHSREMLILEVK